MNKRTRVKSPVFSGDIFERNLGDFAQRDEMRDIKRQIERFGQLVEGLAEMREKPDPFKTQAQINVEYGKRYEEALSAAKRSVEKSIERLVDAQDKARRNMIVKTKLDRVVPDAQEIRAHLRGMTDKQRREFIAKSIDHGRFEVISAIVNTSLPELAGLTPELVTQYQMAYVEKVAPEYLEEEKAIQTAEQMLGMAFDSFRKQAEEMRDPHLEVEAIKMKEQADAADAAFKQALNADARAE
ncbi:hypothetical protein SAMN02927930_00104 [Pseudidiomarina indica]|uniref:Uncharacterized protein n=1 Tax=Pseudidiomarina indica TaxID=1159017 RepID=A0A1G6A370_9GAMM|nr:hypothetical protein [Pseudidiomarina indica]SDB02888.1 hypothetical protein SAMN02927930_00104 [Pseudidiomarina indica]